MVSPELRVVSPELPVPDKDKALLGWTECCGIFCCLNGPICKDVLLPSIGVGLGGSRGEQWQRKLDEMERHSECTRHVVIDDNDEAQSDPAKNIKVYRPGAWADAVRECCGGS